MWNIIIFQSTCKIIKIYYNTIRIFLIPLNSNDIEKLYYTIERYREYQAKYHLSKEY